MVPPTPAASSEARWSLHPGGASEETRARREVGPLANDHPQPPPDRPRDVPAENIKKHSAICSGEGLNLYTGLGCKTTELHKNTTLFIIYFTIHLILLFI